MPGVAFDGGRWVLAADAVRYAPRWMVADAKPWGRCPFALIGFGGVDSNVRLESVARVLDLVAWTKDGAPLRDMEPAPSDALFDAVLLARRELRARWDAERET